MDANRVADVSPFNIHVGVKCIAAELGTSIARIPDRVELTNDFGSVHGGALFSVGEIASAYVVRDLLGKDLPNIFAIIRRAEIDYLRMAYGAVTATAAFQSDADQILGSLHRDGRATAMIDVVLCTDNREVAARMRLEWRLKRRVAVL